MRATSSFPLVVSISILLLLIDVGGDCLGRVVAPADDLRWGQQRESASTSPERDAPERHMEPRSAVHGHASNATTAAAAGAAPAAPPPPPPPPAGASTPPTSPPPPPPSDAPTRYALTDEAEACRPYRLDALDDAFLATYPQPWARADILPNDDEARRVFDAIMDSGIVPADVAVKPTTVAAAHYDASDPDCWWTFNPSCHQPKHNPQRIPADVWLCPEGSTWGLTYDDGPNCTAAVEILPWLRQEKLRASFYFIGSNVLLWPVEAQLHLVDGHHINVHTWSHAPMTSLTNSQAFAELYYTAKLLRQVVGVTPLAWRPPFGDIDDRIRAIATGLGLATHHWSRDTDDWEPKPPSVIQANYDAIIAAESPEVGAIVLTHELNDVTVQLFESAWPRISSRYRNVVPLTACLNVSLPYAEPTSYVYPTWQEYVVEGRRQPDGLPDLESVRVEPDASYDALGAARATQAAGNTLGGVNDVRKGTTSGAGAAGPGAQLRAGLHSNGADRVGVLARLQRADLLTRMADMPLLVVMIVPTVAALLPLWL